MASSGDIRLTPTSFIVLGLIDWLGPSTPYRLKKMLERSIADFHPVPHTTFYAEPARLAAAGYLDESREAAGRRRKEYSLTEQGREALRDWLADPNAEPTEVRAPAMLKVFFGADPEPLANAALARHTALLEGFESVRARVDPKQARSGQIRALDTGIEYHSFWVRAWNRLSGPRA